MACPHPREQPEWLGPRKKGAKILRTARGEGHPLPSGRYAGLRLLGTKLREGCDKFSDLSARGDEFQIISREVAITDDKISDLSARGDEFRIISWRLMVTKHQPEGAIADDKISDLLAKDRWFQSIN